MRIKLRNGNLIVTLNEPSSAIAAFAAAGLTWVVRFGADACLAADLSCTGSGEMLTCR